MATELTREDWKNLVDHVLNASNPLALINQLTQLLPAIKNDADKRGIAIQYHPMMVLYVNQLYQLVGFDQNFDSAYADAKRQAQTLGRGIAMTADEVFGFGEIFEKLP